MEGRFRYQREQDLVNFTFLYSSLWRVIPTDNPFDFSIYDEIEIHKQPDDTRNEKIYLSTMHYIVVIDAIGQLWNVLIE